MATRDVPLSDAEARSLVMTRSVYANNREALVKRIETQNELRDGLRGS